MGIGIVTAMKSLFETVRPRIIPALQVWSAVALAVLYLLFWIVEINTTGTQWQSIFISLPLAAMIALSQRLPVVSFILLIVVPLCEILRVIPSGLNQVLPLYLGGCFVAFFVGLQSEGLFRYLAIPFGAIASALVAYLGVQSRAWLTMTTVGGDSSTGHPRWIEFFTVALAFFGLYTAAWAIGVALASLTLGRVLKAAESQLEETDFELRLQLDRARISRDVHDALAHSLTIVVSQAEGALALQAMRPEVAEESLRNIADVSRTALIDVRSLVERIQDDDLLTMKQTTADLESLAEHMTTIGMQTAIQILGEARILAPSQDVAVFRIVQESLTNTLKHSGALSSATVVLDWRENGLIVLVSSLGGTPLIVEAGPARGVGIEGMKERARLAGGWLTAVSAGENLFIVTAFIPLESVATGDRHTGPQRSLARSVALPVTGP